MAANYVLVCALALIAAAAATPAGVCPDPDPMDHTVHLADLTNCNAFYRCDHATPKKEFCPAGLHFNPTLQVCDWPDQAGCVLSTSTAPQPTTSVTTPPSPSTTPTPTTPDQGCGTTPDNCKDPCDKKSCESDSSSSGSSSESCEDKKPVCPETTTPSCTESTTTAATTTPTNPATTSRPTSTSKPTTTSGPPVVPGECPYPFGPDDVCRDATEHHWHLPHPDDPTKFYKCEIASCRAFEFDCPDNLIFNPDIQVCDWPSQEKCPSPFGPDDVCRDATEHHWHMPDPTDPTKFYKCELSTCTAHPFDCPEGLVFNPAIQVCDWPTQEKCPSPFGPDDVCRDATEHHWHMPDPTDQTKFYKCELSTCTAHPFDCEEGLVFNPAIQVCDWPSTVRQRLAKIYSKARP